MNRRSHKEHGTTGSYVTGFILSLIFTIIPYYLVVNKVLTGNTMLAAILGIAIIQMFIQIFFFLHLGRGPKPFYNVVFFFATAGLIVIVVGASLFIMENLYRTMSPKEVTIRQAQKENISQVGGNDTGACKEHRANHIVTIRDGMVMPSYVQTARCDTLTFDNKDSQTYTIAFGSHVNPSTYGGESEIEVEGGDTEIITLNETGSFTYLDHLTTSLQGGFTVNNE